MNLKNMIFRGVAVVLFLLLAPSSAKSNGQQSTSIDWHWQQRKVALEETFKYYYRERRVLPSKEKEVLEIFHQEVSSWKQLPPYEDHPPLEWTAKGYYNYFDRLCALVVSIPNLDEDTLELLLMKSVYPRILGRGKGVLNFLIDRSESKDVRIRGTAIHMLSYILNPPEDADDIDAEWMRRKFSLNHEEKETLKNIFLKALKDTDENVRLSAFVGLLPYKSDSKIGPLLKKTAETGFSGFLQEEAQNMLK